MKIRKILAISAFCTCLLSTKVMAANPDKVDIVNTIGVVAQANNEEVRIMDEKKDIAVDKKWTIDFNKELKADSVNSENVQVLNSKGQTVGVSLSLRDDKKSIEIIPPSSKYERGQTYSIVIKKDICDKSNQTLKKEVRMNFTTVKSSSSSSGNSGSSSSSVNVDPTLIEARDGLEKVKSIVKTDAEKKLVNDLKNGVISRIENPSASVDTASLKAQYHALSQSEKDDFQSAILSNFTIGTLLKIKSLFS